jgi:flavin reductase (DIM6/NTAB) family NADH-FMN oxidoreductase RutF
MSEDFGELVGPLDPAMIVVTTAARDERAGCLVGFHAQCSIDPPRYVVWLSKANHTYRVVLHAGHFAVHLLTEDDADVAEHFGTQSGDDVDKFAGIDWDAGPDGVPLLRRLPHRLVLRKHTVLDDGSDHLCLVGVPVAVQGAGSFPPLRLSSVVHLDAGHRAEERPVPATERRADG